MTYNVYSIQDLKTSFFSPSLDVNHEAAVRGFAHALSEAKGLMAYAPQDYRLFYVGQFDADRGILFPNDVPELIAEGKDYMPVRPLEM